jgi:hypothetical protein
MNVAKKQKNHTEMQKLPCKLTADDITRKTQELVQLEQSEALQKAGKKAKVSELNAQLKQVRADIEQRVKELSDGTEMREVEVEAQFDNATKKVRYVRLDTNEEVSARDMDAFDLQENFAYEGDALPPPAKPQPRAEDADEDGVLPWGEDEEPSNVTPIGQKKDSRKKTATKGKGRKK